MINGLSIPSSLLIWQRGAVAADESLEQTKLLLSGLVFRKHGQLRIFHQNWSRLSEND